MGAAMAMAMAITDQSASLVPKHDLQNPAPDLRRCPQDLLAFCSGLPMCVAGRAFETCPSAAEWLLPHDCSGKTGIDFGCINAWLCCPQRLSERGHLAQPYHQVHIGHWPARLRPFEAASSQVT